MIVAVACAHHFPLAKELGFFDLVFGRQQRERLPLASQLCQASSRTYLTLGEPPANGVVVAVVSFTSIIAENSSSSQMTTLATIPLEVLLLILRELDTIDAIRLGMVSCALDPSAFPHQYSN